MRNAIMYSLMFLVMDSASWLKLQIGHQKSGQNDKQHGNAVDTQMVAHKGRQPNRYFRVPPRTETRRSELSKLNP